MNSIHRKQDKARVDTIVIPAYHIPLSSIRRLYKRYAHPQHDTGSLCNIIENVTLLASELKQTQVEIEHLQARVVGDMTRISALQQHYHLVLNLKAHVHQFGSARETTLALTMLG